MVETDDWRLGKDCDSSWWGCWVGWVGWAVPEDIAVVVVVKVVVEDEDKKVVSGGGRAGGGRAAGCGASDSECGLLWCGSVCGACVGCNVIGTGGDGEGEAMRKVGGTCGERDERDERDTKKRVVKSLRSRMAVQV